MAPLVHLGTCTLCVDPAVAGPFAFRFDRHWTPFDATFLDSANWAPGEEDKIAILSRCLSDTVLGVECRLQRRAGVVLVRVAIMPNDAPKRWKISSVRTRLLKDLFGVLERGWNGGGGKLMESNVDLGGMLGLYALIDSPPEPQFTAGEFLGDNEVFTALTNYDNPMGVNTLMYKYQIRSVARMLQMESQPAMLVDPVYTTFSDAETGTPFYVDLKSMDIILRPDRYPLPKGGILCEQMGVGKTLMCLALILASRHQPTRPPTGTDQVSEVYTDVGLREYSTETASAMRQAIGLSGGSITGTPSLASMCADLVALHNPAIRHSWPGLLTPSAERMLDTRTCVYYRFPPPVRLPRGAKRVPDFLPQRFILAQTTLVVVPQILVAQWLVEAETHLDEGALKIWTMGNQKHLPPIEELVRYDILLFSLEQFSAQGKKAEDDLYYETELMKARWKRIILDEGNNANNMGSNAMLLAKALSIERRWIVSGTPTTRLKQGTEDAEHCFLESEGLEPAPTPGLAVPNAPRWTRHDSGDVTRIGNMLKGFLSSELFQHDDFTRLIAKPLRKATGPEYGAVERMRQIMSAVMVKHRPGVIREEVDVPPLTLSVQPVQFTHWQRLTYNALTSLIVSNVYTSNFEDQDYFLHPRNTEAFNQVVTNLHLACTWFPSSTMDLEGTITRNLDYLEKKAKKNTPYQFRDMLLEANEHMRRALEEPGWNEWMRNETASAPYDGTALPPALLDGWSLAADSGVPVIDSAALKLICDLNEPGAELSDLIRIGWDERAFHPRCQELAELMERQEAAWKAGKRVAAEVDLEHHRDDSKAAADRPKMPPIRSRKEKVVRTKRFDVGDLVGLESEMDSRLDEAQRNARRMAAAARGPRPLPSVIPTSTRSAKINFVVGTVLTAPATDKFVMFGTMDEIAHVQEALSFVGVRSAFVVQSMTPAARNRALKEFAKPSMRVIFLELKFAARGLTLTLANRMIFLSPVWSLDVQAQAIKRIHRIGQTRPTHIDILVTQGTFEEDIVQREASMRSQLMEQSYSRALIENPRFVATEHDDQTTSFPIRLVPIGSELNEVENEEYARLIAAVASPYVTPLPTPSGTAATTPIVTPGTPDNVDVTMADATMDPMNMGMDMDVDVDRVEVANGSLKRHFDSTMSANVNVDAHTAPEPAKPPRPKKRIRFADEE